MRFENGDFFHQLECNKESPALNYRTEGVVGVKQLILVGDTAIRSFLNRIDDLSLGSL